MLNQTNEGDAGQATRDEAGPDDQRCYWTKQPKVMLQPMHLDDLTRQSQDMSEQTMLDKTKGGNGRPDNQLRYWTKHRQLMQNKGNARPGNPGLYILDQLIGDNTTPDNHASIVDLTT